VCVCECVRVCVRKLQLHALVQCACNVAVRLYLNIGLQVALVPQLVEEQMGLWGLCASLG
jgi:hypothetical protein